METIFHLIRVIQASNAFIVILSSDATAYLALTCPCSTHQLPTSYPRALQLNLLE